MRITPIEFVVLCLASWRLMHFFVYGEEGPFGVLVKIQKVIYVGTVYNNLIGTVCRELNKGLNCKWCCSVWFAGLLSIPFSVTFLGWVTLTLGIAATVPIFDEIVRRIYKNG